MQVKPVVNTHLIYAILIPIIAVFIFIFILVNMVQANKSSTTNHINKPVIEDIHVTQTDSIVTYEFTKQDYLLTDTDGNSLVSPSDTLQYKVIFTNTGSTIPNLTITDTVDPNSTLVSGSLIVSPLANPDNETTPMNTQLMLNAPGLLGNDDLQGPGTRIASFDATTVQGGLVLIDDNGRFAYTPPPNFTGTDSFTYTLSNPAGNDSTTVTIQVVTNDIGLSKTVNNTTPNEEDQIVYKIVANNNSNAPLNNIIISDTVPTGITFDDYAATSGSYASDLWTIDTINSGLSETLTITGTAQAETVFQTITNTAVFISSNPPDTNPGNDRASATITVQPLVDIAVSKSVNEQTPVELAPIIYTITATNNGPNNATGVQLTDQLPTGLAYIESVATQGSYTSGNGIWNIGNLSTEQTETLTITATVNSATVAQTITNSANVTAVNETDSIPENDSDNATITVHKTPTALDDDPSNTPAYEVSSGATLNQPSGTSDPVERNDDVGFPVATITRFGGGSLGGSVSDYVAGSTITPLPTHSNGSLTVNADGSFSFTPPVPFIGNFQFSYRLSNTAGTSDATVTIRVQDGPTAVDDPNGGLPSNSQPGSTPYHINAGSNNNAITGLLTNDSLGNPPATMTQFGGGTLGGTVTDYTPGNTAMSGGHTLLVNNNGSLTYTPPATFIGYFTFQYRLSNPVGTDDATVTIAVGERPSCSNDPYTATGNIHISHNAVSGILANDSGNNVQITAVQSGIVGTTQNTAKTGLSGASGRITVQADGSFIYDPPPGFTGSDSFTYTIDNDFNTAQTCTATITISDMVWFIDSSASGNNNGTMSNPFTSTTAFNNANNGAAFEPTTGSLIYLLQGNGYNGADGIGIQNNQRLIGQAINLATVIMADSASNNFPPPFGTARTPLLQPSNDNGLDLALDNTIRGLDIGNTPTGFALNGTAVGSPIINTINITGTGGTLRVASSGNFANNVTFNTLESTSSSTQNLQLVNVSGNLTVNNGGSGLSGSTETAVSISGGTVTLNYPGNITQSANFPTVEVSNGHSGSLTFNGNINATNGTGLQFDDAGGSYTFNGTTMLNGGDAGIDIIEGSQGTFAFNDTTITDPSRTAFNIQSSNADVIYSGSIDDVDDTAVVIHDNDNASVTFQSGRITSGFGGMTIYNNNNSLITFNSAIDFDTASDDALVLRNNSDSTIHFTDKIDITTTTGEAFLAVNSGIINATGNGNIINTTNGGTAVFIEETTIGPNNITFQSISTDQATNGILLNNTDNVGTLIVSGGTIQDSDGDGIFVQNGNITLRNMNILNSTNSGFYAVNTGSATQAIRLENSTIQNTNNGIFVQLTGAGDMQVLLKNNSVSQSDFEGITVKAGTNPTDNGRMDLTIDGNVVNTPNDPTTSGAYGTLLQSRYLTTLCANILNNQSIGANGAEDFQLDRRETSLFFMQNFTSNATTTIINNGNSKTGGGIATVDTIGEPFAGAPNCAAPTVFDSRDTAVSPQANSSYDISHTINTLPAGKSITLIFNVQINELFLDSMEQISNQAFASANGFPLAISDDPDTAVPNDSTITQIFQTQFTYLPLILNNVINLPDLIVRSITPTTGNLTVVLENVGNTAVTDEFWVDAYFNPSTSPTNVNQTIQTLDVEGIVWGVTSAALPIASGEQITLTVNDTYYNATLSNFTGTVPIGNIYVQVDSANVTTSYGAVLETHEATGEPYNNIQMITVSTTASIPVYTHKLTEQLTIKRP